MKKTKFNLDNLTIKEKAGQLVQIAPFFFIKDLKNEVYGSFVDLKLTEEEIFLTGSVLGIGGPEEKKAVQKAYLSRSRHQIPLIFMADVIHGCKTIYPVPLAQACSFNPNLVKKAAKMAAREALAYGIDLTFSPMSDLVRDPRWGRVVESFGEDPYLNYVFSKATAKGYDSEGLLSCTKHFAAYGLSEAGRDYNTVDLSRLSLLNYFINGHQGALDSGSSLVMTAFNTFEYIPATINKYLLQDVLKDYMGYKDAVVIADYDSLLQTKAHGVSKNDYDASVKGINAGLEIEMASSSYLRCLPSAVDNKDVSINTIDNAVNKVLKLKEKAGIFNNPYRGSREELDKLALSKEHKEISYNLAVESAVLLKNKQNILPLSKDLKVSLIGNYASSKRMLGPWSWHGNPEDNTSLKSLIKPFYTTDSENYLDVDTNEVKKTDVIILAIGEHDRESGEAHSKTDIRLSREQVDLIKYLKQLEIPIVLTLFSGRPIVLSEIIDDVDALMSVFFLGTMASEAIYDLLYGIKNPSGKLAMTFPRSVGQIPIYYNHLNTGRPFLDDDNPYTSLYLDMPNTPLYDFGIGLSYSKFEIDATISNLEFTKETLPTISVNVKNISDVPGHETILLYVKDVVAEISRPVKELKQFEKIYLQPDEEMIVDFKLGLDDLSYVHPNYQKYADPGEFEVIVANKVFKINFKEDK